MNIHTNYINRLIDYTSKVYSKNMKGTQKLSKYQYLVGIDLTNEDTSEFSMNRVDLSNKSKKFLKYSDRLSATKAAHLQKNGSIEKQQREILQI